MDTKELKGIRGALYLRESSDDTRKAPPIAAQEERGRQWAAEHGVVIVAVYKDDGWSGGDWKRPDWNQSVKDARRHLWAVLWTWDQDRLARDTEQFLWYYRNLREAGVRIWEDTSNSLIDMETLGGRVKHQSLAQAAEIFRLVTSEKVKKTYERKKKAGERWGRKQIVFDLTRARELRAQKMGWRTIAEKLLEEGKVEPPRNEKGEATGKPELGYQTVRRALQNRAILEHPPAEPSASRKN